MAGACPHCSTEHPAEPGARCPATGKLIDSFARGAVLEGKYEIVRELARGGMGVVYVARHLALGRQVAVKVLLGDLASDAELVSRFEQEARAASAIGHPNIIHVYDLGRTSGGLLYQVMELLEGQSLATLLVDAGRLPISRAVRLVDQVLSALAAAHKNGIVHRDLKPDNIFVVQTEYQPDFVKLLDFGISKILASNAPGHLGGGRKATRVGTVMGTPEYMAPEQASGQVDQVDARTDLYATGVVLYELLCGDTPFTGENYNAIMVAILAGAHRRARELRPAIPERLEQVVETAMARARDSRYPSAAAMRDALAAAQSDDPTRATGAAPVLELDDADEGEDSGVLAGLDASRDAPVLELPSFSGAASAPAFAPAASAPTPVAPHPFLAAAPAPRAAAPVPRAPLQREDPFAAPDDGPEAALLLESEAPRAHGTPRPMPIEAPAPAARARSAPLPRSPAPARPPVAARGGGRTLLWLVLIAGLGAGGWVAYRQLGDRLPFLGRKTVAVAIAVTPAGAQLRLDGQPAAPPTLALRPGAHELSASAPGHVARRVRLDARAGAQVTLELSPTLPPVSGRDPLLPGQPMPAPHAAAGAPERAASEAALAKLARVRECTATVADGIVAARDALAAPPGDGREPAPVDANLGWSLDAAARCLDQARAAAPALAPLDQVAGDDAQALRQLATLLRGAGEARKGKSKALRRELAAGVDAGLAADEALRRALIDAEETAQQGLLARLAHDGSLGFAARRYVLAETAAWRRGNAALAQAAHDELAARCEGQAAPGACASLLAAAAAHRAGPRLDALNALVAAYAACTTD